jgi:hypothetical protein
MNLQRISSNAERPDILRAKRRYGFWYGAAVGFGFSVFCWGLDAYTLSMHHALYPWAKFIAGSILCMVTGGITGWLTARVGKAVYGLIFWLMTALIFSWLTVNLPTKFVERFIFTFEPAARELLHYTYYPEFGTRIFAAYMWIAIFMAIAGLLQLPLSDSAVFSPSAMSKLWPLLFVFVLMSICGAIMDNTMVNEPLRSSVAALDHTIQFIVDNQGAATDKAEARKMRVGAFNTTKELVTQQRKLAISGYDAQFGEINVLVRFERGWVECLVMYNQPLSCKAIEVSP